MRRNTKNNKVLRAITIGLATMIAVTSTPVTVLADDENTNEAPVGGGDGPATEGDSTSSSDSGESKDLQDSEPTEVTVPDEVKSETGDLKSAADSIDTSKNKEGEVTGGITPANNVLGTILINPDGSTIKVDKVELKEEGKEDKTFNNVTPGAAEGDVPAGSVQEDLGIAGDKLEGVYTDINTLQQKINEFYLANHTLNNGGTYETTNSEGGTETVSLTTGINDFCFVDQTTGNVCFYANNTSKEVWFEIATISVPVLDENGEMVLDENGKPVTTSEYTVKKVDTRQNAEPDTGASLIVTNKDVQDANNNVDAANSAGTLSEAVAFASSADDAITEAENLFKVDSAKLDEAAAFVEKAKTKYNEIDAQAQKAKEAYKAIQDFVNEMGTEGSNATALHEQLKAAEAKALALKTAAEKEREKISQYELLVDIQKADAAVQNVADDNIKNNKSVTAGDYWKEGRKLCYLLIEYYFNNGDLAVLDKAGNPIEIPEGGKLEIGANFDKKITYWAPSFSNDKVTKDGDGNPIYKTVEVTDDYTITGTAAKDRSKIEFVKKDEDGNITGMAYKTIDDKATGQGWIFASSAKSNDCNNNRVVVNIKDKGGNIIGTAYFNAKTNSDGSLYLYERHFNEVETEVAGQAGVKGKDAVPESWETEDGKKIVVGQETPTTHKVNIDNNNADDGFYAIDTDTSEVVGTPINNVSKELSAEMTDTRYSLYSVTIDTYVPTGEAGDPTYEHELVSTGEYEKKKEEGSSTVSTAYEAALVSAMKCNQGMDVQLKCYSESGDSEVFSYSGKEGYLQLSQLLSDVLSGSAPMCKYQSFEVDFSGWINDYDKPIKQDVIKETTRQKHEKTTTTLSSMISNGLYDNNDGAYYDDEESARLAMQAEVDKLPADAIVDINKTEVGKFEDTGKYFFRIIYYTRTDDTQESVNTVEDDKIVSQTAYKADKYTVHNAGQEEVKEEIGWNSYKKTELKWDTDAQSKKEALTKGENGETKNVLLKDSNNQITNRTSYKEVLNTLANADKVVAEYDSLLTNITAAKKATQGFLDMLGDYSEGYEMGNIPPLVVADLEASDGQAVTDEKPLTFEQYIDGVLARIWQPIGDASEYLADREAERDALGERIAATRLRVDNIDLSRFYTNNDDDDDDSSSGSGSDSGAGSYVLPTAGSLGGYDLTGLTFDELGTGAGAGRTVARGGAATSGVLGVKNVPATNDTEKKDDKGSKKADKSGNSTGSQDLVKVENNLVPLAATPFEEGAGFNWALFAVAGAAAAGVIGYGNYKRKAALNEMDSAKKSKKK